MSAQQYYNDKSTQISLPKNSPLIYPQGSPMLPSSSAVPTIPAFPTIQAELPQPYVATYQPVQVVQQPVVYFVHDIPYYCYQEQPDVLYPVYVPDFSQMYQEQQPRVLGEMVSAVGDVLENKVNSLENYVNKMEQQQVQAVQEKIKTSCFGLCC